MLTGEQLRTLRKIVGLPAEEVAEEMFVSRSTITMIETGKNERKSMLNYYNLWLRRWADVNLSGDILKKFKAVASAYMLSNR